MKSSDLQLVRQTLLGERDAFGTLVLRYQNAVYGLAYHRVRNFEDARDITQRTFLEAYRCLDRLRDHARFSHWLYGIAANQCRMWHRARRDNVASLEASLASGEVSEPRDTRPTPEEMVEQSALHASVRQAIDALPKKQRLAVTLFYMDGLSYKEVAGFLNVPVSTVQSRLQVARRTLREEMLQMTEEFLAEHKLDRTFAIELAKEALSLFEQEQQLDRAIASLRRVIDDSTDDEVIQESYWLLAQIHKYRRDVDQEVSLLQEALSKYPDSFVTAYRSDLADAFMRRGDFEAVLKAYQDNAFPDEGEPGGVPLRVGQCHEYLGHVEAARWAYREIIEMSSAVEPIRGTARRWLLRLEGCPEPTPQQVQRLRQLRGEAFASFEQRRDYMEAIPLFERLLEETVGLPLHYRAEAFVCLGMCHEFLGQLTHAVEAYRRGMEANHLTDSSQWQSTVAALALERDGTFEEALVTYEAMVEEWGTAEQHKWFAARAQLGRGRCLERLGRQDDARATYESLLVNEHAADIYLKVDWMWAHWPFAAERALQRLG